MITSSENDIVSIEKLCFAYDGPSVCGEIEARDLGHALSGISDLLYEANSTLNNFRYQINVKVQSDFKAGSFEVNLMILEKCIDRFCNLLCEHVSIRDTLQLLGLTAWGLIHIIKELKNQEYEVKESVNGKVKIVTKEGAVVEVENRALVLLENDKIRRSILEIINPLKSKGVEKFQVRKGNDVLSEINKTEAPYFEYGKTSDVINEYFTEKICEIRVLTFEEDLQWKLSDGELKFNAKMSDEEFNKNMNNVSFRKGDKFKMRIKTLQYADKNGKLKTSHEIIKVLEKTPALQQMKFDF